MLNYSVAELRLFKTISSVYFNHTSVHKAGSNGIYGRSRSFEHFHQVLRQGMYGRLCHPIGQRSTVGIYAHHRAYRHNPCVVQQLGQQIPDEVDIAVQVNLHRPFPCFIGRACLPFRSLLCNRKSEGLPHENPCGNAPIHLYIWYHNRE